VEDIYRVELELKAESKFIPWSAIGTRDEVFAGAYPFCADLLPGAPHIKLESIPEFRAPQMELEKALDHARRAYGGIVRIARMAYGDDRKVLERISSEKPSQALIEAGVLTVTHV
jgi:DNA relaxase NicK